MNPIETTTETSKRKLEIHCVPSGGSQICNSTVPLRDQIVTSSVYGDSAMIKYVIGATNNNEQQSILKKSLTNHSPTNSTQTIISSNIIKGATPAVETQQPSKVLTQSEPKVNTSINSSAITGQSLIKLPTIKSLQKLSEKQVSHNSIIKRSLSTQIKQQQMHAKPMQSRSHGHILYKCKNGHSGASHPEIMSTSLLARKSEQPVRKLPTLKDINKPKTSRLEAKPLNNFHRRTYGVDTSAAEVTLISSTVTLTKAPISSNKQAKTLPSPLVTIEKKGTNASLFNCSKQGKIHLPNSTESMDIVVNTIGGSKMISLGNDKDAKIPESPQKSLLIKQSSPPNREKTPPKLSQLKPKQQSLLKVNSLARLLHTSPRTKRSKSLTAIGTSVKKPRRMSLKNRRSSIASDGEVSPANSLKRSTADPLEIKQENAEVSVLQPKSKESLLCDEQIETLPSSNSNSSFEGTPKKEPATTDINSFQLNTVLGMLSVFNMLSWKDRVGSSKDSSIQFQLNEFNILQIAEKCPPRDRIHTAYEKPIYERESSTNTSDYSDPLYLCRRCNCRGAAIDFLAPEFCSYECFRHESRKRPRLSDGNTEKFGRDRIKKVKKSSIGDGVNSIYGSRSGMDSALGRLAPKRIFSWDSYLSITHSEPAPIDLFLNPFPCGLNLFEIGMKLEAIDPEHNSLFCVCTVVEKKGYRLKLKFDGYSKIHNFWVNADSMDIFPPGWCAKTNRVLQPPKGMNLLTFNWPTYLNKTKSTPAPRGLFTHLNSSSSTNPFKVGMRLEADDLKNTGKVCVATIADVLDNRVLIHFDGWDESYDYWIDINSPYIHPIGWHKAHSLELVPPPDWEKGFSWSEYLEFTRSQPVQSRMFSRRYPIEFTTGMKLEVVDIKNPCLIRPGTVMSRNEYKILIHLDGWPSEHTFWMHDDSPDIHPIGWSNETDHTLEPPPGYDRPPAEVSDKPDMPCPIKGCRGIGNAKRLDLNFHANEDTCPYAIKNWNNEIEKPSRLDEIGRFVYTGEVPEKKRRSTSEQNVIDVSSEDQKHHIEQDCKHQVPIKQVETHQAPPPGAHLINEEIRLAREYLCDYGPRLKQNYFIWRENGNFNPENIQKNPLEWTTKEVGEYITTKCHPIGHIFHREDIDGLALLNMHQTDLTDILKIKLGPAVKIFSHILHLRSQVVSRFSCSKP